MTALINQALRVAQEYDLAIFPVSSSKRPIIKGWQAKATKDPDEIRELFAMKGAAGIGVPCGPDNDIICFDLDFGHTDDPGRKAALLEWYEEHLQKHVEAGDAMLRETKSGGWHILMSYPDTKPPRQIMPKLDVILRGFYFVWWMEGGGYTRVAGELTDAAPPAGALVIRERAFTGGGGDLPTAEEAHEIMMSNGDGGQRHDALLRMTHDWAEDHPDENAAQLCVSFDQWFRDIYGDLLDPERLDELLEWRLEDGTLHGELGRAMAGVRTSFKDGVPANMDSLLARAGAKLKAKKGVASVAKEVQTEHVKAQATASVLLTSNDELAEEDLPDIEWVIEDLIPRGNLIGMAGPSGGGKTRWFSGFVCCLSAGQTHVMGLPKAEPANVMYVANEERQIDIKRRIRAFAIANDIEGGRPIHIRGKDDGQLRLVRDFGKDGFQIDADVLEWLVGYLNEYAIDVVIFDPFVTLGAEEENAASGVNVLMEALQTLTARTKAAVVFVHHTPKGDRGAAADEWRGNPSAFRGSGAIYSPLDIAFTLTPYLPPVCHAKGEGPRHRRALEQAQRNKRVARFAVIDSTKERESEGFGSVVYRFVGQPVREGGKPIGALQVVDERVAIAECEAGINGVGELVDAVQHKTWAAAVLKTYNTPGRTKVTLKDLAMALDREKPAGWEPSNKPIRVRDGAGKRLTDVLSNTIRLGNVQCYLVHDDRRFEWVVEDLR